MRDKHGAKHWADNRLDHPLICKGDWIEVIEFIRPIVAGSALPDEHQLSWKPICKVAPSHYVKCIILRGSRRPIAVASTFRHLRSQSGNGLFETLRETRNTPSSWRCKPRRFAANVGLGRNTRELLEHAGGGLSLTFLLAPARIRQAQAEEVCQIVLNLALSIEQAGVDAKRVRSPRGGTPIRKFQEHVVAAILDGLLTVEIRAESEGAFQIAATAVSVCAEGGGQLQPVCPL